MTIATTENPKTKILNPKSPPIRLKNLQRYFERGGTTVKALRGVDLTLNEGDFVALVGPSGSGKSTLLNLLGGLDHPTGGELWLDEVPLHSAPEAERTRHRRERIGFIFQSFNLLPKLTALENVAVPLMLAGVGKQEREAKATVLLERVGLGHRLTHYPTEMSGGEQQRTAIARALVNNPSLVLADEPTGNLDSVSGGAVMSLLRELNEEDGVTLVLVTHDDEVADFAGKIVRLKDGNIVEIEEKDSPSPRLSVSPSPRPPVSKSRLSFGDMLHNALRNLRRRPVRNILTAGGVLIGIITLVSMVSFGVGVQREVQRNFETIGLETVFVNPIFAEQDGFDPFADPVPETPITQGVIDQVRGMAGVESVTPVLGFPRGVNLVMELDAETIDIRVSEGGESRFSLGGSPNEALAGATLGEGDTAGVVLTSEFADNLLAEGGSYADLVGKEVVLLAQLPRGETGSFPSVIKGVRNGFGSRTIDLGIAERAEVKAWWFDKPDTLATDGFDMMMVRTADLGTVSGVIDQIDDMGFATQSLEAVLEVANQVLALLQALLGSVGGLALLVAALGVANTMMMAIYERTREIGLLKALGASPREIRSMFTIEAGLIGVIGGVVGLILGIGVGRIGDYIAHRYLINEGVTGIGDLSVVPLWLGVGAVVFAALIGILAGLYPAGRAAKLDPVSALRHE